MSLNKKKTQAVNLIVDGLPMEKIVAELGLENVSTLMKWMKTDAEFKQAIEEREEIVNEQRERSARRELEAQINDPDTPKTARANAARAILSYRAATERERDTGISVNFTGMPTPKNGKRGDAK